MVEENDKNTGQDDWNKETICPISYILMMYVLPNALGGPNTAQELV